MKNKLLTLMLALLISLNWSSQCLSLTEATHQELNRHVAQNPINGFSLNDYLMNNLGLQRGFGEIINGVDADGRNRSWRVFEWLGYGGEQEDRPGSWKDYLPIVGKPTRSVNHFHNPLRQPWATAGLNDTIKVGSVERSYTGQSQVLWAQNLTQDPYGTLGGNWSWYDARGYYYSALTGKDFAGNVVVHTYAEMQQYYANTFRALGQLMHLVQDASVPEHVRNQIHIAKGYEAKVEQFMKDKKDPSVWNSFLTNPVGFDKSILDIVSKDVLAPRPISRIIDADRYDGSNPDPDTTKTLPDAGQPVGISEYTNANFLSKHTMFTDDLDPTDRHYFPYPRGASATRWKDETNKRWYVKKAGEGDVVNHLAAVSWKQSYVEKNYPNLSVLWRKVGGLDDECYKEYASKLIPRAVGYSAGLLQYFFRGNIEITLPDSGVYAQTDSSGNGFTQVKLKVRNTTPNDEEMKAGAIELVVKYKLALEDPFQSKDVATSADFKYIVVPEANHASSIPRVPQDKPKPQELVFDLTQTPIPLYATDVYLQVVYHGQLGKMINGSFVGEYPGVAVGFKDISEPTPIDIFNDMDRICINKGWCEAGDAASQTYGIDAYPHNLIDSYIRLSSMDNPQVVSDTNHNFYIQKITPGTSSRVFILGDYAGSNISYTGSAQKINGLDTWPHIPGVLCPPGYTTRSPCSDVYKLIKNQTDIDNGVANRIYPTFDLFRGVTTWGGFAVENWPYPANSVCPEE